MAIALESPVMQITPTGVVPVSLVSSVNVEYPGPALHFEFNGTSTPGTPQTLITQVVTLGYLWKLRRIEMISRAYSDFRVLLNADIVKTGKTSPAESTVSLPFDPWISLINPSTVSIVYDQVDGPVLDITARLYYTQEIPA